MEPTGLSPLERLRQQRHERWLNDLQQQLAETLGDLPCRVWLFGSRVRGDWDGVSDADRLRRWQAMAASRSAQWRAVRQQARCVHRRPWARHARMPGGEGRFRWGVQPDAACCGLARANRTPLPNAPVRGATTASYHAPWAHGFRFRRSGQTVTPASSIYPQMGRWRLPKTPHLPKSGEANFCAGTAAQAAKQGEEAVSRQLHPCLWQCFHLCL